MGSGWKLKVFLAVHKVSNPFKGLGKSVNLSINAISMAKSGDSDNQPDCEAEAEYGCKREVHS